MSKQLVQFFMKFIQLTKEGIWTTYTKFQMNQLTLGDI